ncbi:MAG: ribosome silencing factor [Oscillospiraceae bacterium]|jgi:ribosome-associated protein|nr:ribosome silencing factor [Oscillospiraceae bacterium]
MESKELLEQAREILDSKKAVDLKTIATTTQTIIADYFLIATGTSSTHVRALADELEASLKAQGVTARGIEGRTTGWILLDYGTVLVHIFTKDQREYYNIERLWE